MLLFILCWLLSSCIWLPQKPASRQELFDALLKGSITFSVGVYLITEILSYFEALNTSNLLIFYGISALVLCYFPYRIYQQGYLPKIKITPPFASWGILGIVVVLGAEAVYFPPNNYDSMSYHMARVAHWAQNQSVAFYPTGIARQLFSSPLAEYFILHTYLLQGSDLWANAIQWAALVGNLALIARIIGHIGGHRYQQLAGVIIYLINPMVILQSTTTQNDLLAGFYLLASFYFILEHKTKDNIVWLSLAISLGALVKFTSLLFVLPLLLLHLPYLLKQVVKKGFIALPIALLILGPFMYRNQRTFGNVLGPKPDSPMHIAVTNSAHSLGITYSNSLRTFATELALPIGIWNQGINAGVHAMHAMWGMEDNPKEGTYGDYVFNSNFGYTEDNAGNIVGTLLFVLTMIVGIRQRKKIPHVGFLLTACLLGFILFCSFIRYNPMLVRLLVGLYGLNAICMGYILAYSFGPKSVRWMAMGLLLPLPWLVINKSKPLIVAENWVRRWQGIPQQRITMRDMQRIQRSPWAKEIAPAYEIQEGQYMLRPALSQTQKARLTSLLLDSVQLAPRRSAWQMTREENYFQNKLSRLEAYQAIKARCLAKGYTKIGMAWGYDGMEYPWWAMMPGCELVDVHYDSTLRGLAKEKWVQGVISEGPDLGPGWPKYRVERIGEMYWMEFGKAVRVP
jgi:hypothetical protein